MGVRSKTLVTVLLVGVVIGAITLQSKNTSLFKGQLNKEDLDGLAEVEETETPEDALPDLKATLVVITPQQSDGDVILDVTLENLGPGEISGNKPFKYALYLNDIEVFSNVDSYTSMVAGDSFNFQYPVSRLIYAYENEGNAKVILDPDNTVKEVNEKNNTVELQYSF